ncbi:MAG: hypothetical protein ACI3ZQ_05040 [Candidatus Cryptobacteroides sp.]
MIEVSSHFCLIEPEQIQERLLNGGKITPSADMSHFASRGKVLFSQEPETGDNGLSYSQTFRAVVPDEGIIDYNGRQLYVGIFRSDGSVFIIGTGTEVPLIVVTPHENVFVVETHFETPTAVII